MPEASDPETGGNAGDFFLTDDRSAWMDSSSRVIGACAEMFSRLFLAMKECIGRDRMMKRMSLDDGRGQCLAEDDYKPHTPNPKEEAALEMACAMASSMFGQGLAEYMRLHFLSAIESGDMRALKIRLLFIRARNSISDPATRRGFAERMEYGIRTAEEKAGCRPDHSPRRMSKWEKMRKLRIEARKSLLEKMQPELNLTWPDGTPVFGNCSEGADECTCRSPLRPESESAAYRYGTTDEILEDIRSGAIAPYESAEKICDDFRSGKITEVDAVMLACALDKYSPVSDDRYRDGDLEFESEYGDVTENEDGGDCDEDGYCEYGDGGGCRSEERWPSGW